MFSNGSIMPGCRVTIRFTGLRLREGKDRFMVPIMRCREFSNNARLAKGRLRRRSSVGRRHREFVSICALNCSKVLRSRENLRKTRWSQPAENRAVRKTQEVLTMIRIPSLAPILYKGFLHQPPICITFASPRAELATKFRSFPCRSAGCGSRAFYLQRFAPSSGNFQNPVVG